MRVLTVLTLLAGFLAGQVSAACSGQDLRPTLTSEEQAAMAEGIAARPYPVGNHWRATRGEEVLHLVGTVHLDDPGLAGPVSRLAPLIEDAAIVLLEMTAAEKTEMQKAMGTSPDLLLLPDTTLPELLAEDDWQRLSDALRARGMPPFMAARFRPWYVSMLLSLPPCLAQGLTAEAGLDARIEQMAVFAGVPVQALEAFDTGFRAFDEVPMAAQVDMLRASLTAPSDNEDMFATVLASYLDEAHAESWLLAQVLAPRFTTFDEAAEEIFETLGANLLDARNRAWIPVILRALEDTDGTVVAAFGAGHLSGEAGVLALLATEGFVLERQPF